MRRRLLSALLIALGVWVGVEIYDKGIDHAFGGALAGLTDPLQSYSSTDASLKDADEDRHTDGDDND
jgi:hypothetical protein